MDPYRGIVKIECSLQTCPHKMTGNNIQPQCMGCDLAITSIVNLEGKPVFVLRLPERGNAWDITRHCAENIEIVAEKRVIKKKKTNSKQEG